MSFVVINTTAIFYRATMTAARPISLELESQTATEATVDLFAQLFLAVERYRSRQFSSSLSSFWLCAFRCTQLQTQKQAPYLRSLFLY